MKKIIQRWNFFKHFSLSLIISLCFLLGMVNIIRHLKMIGTTDNINGSVTILSNTADGPSAIYIPGTLSPFEIFVAFAVLLIFLLVLYIPIKRDLSRRVNIH